MPQGGTDTWPFAGGEDPWPWLYAKRIAYCGGPIDPWPKVVPLGFKPDDAPTEVLLSGLERVLEVTSAAFLHAGNGTPDIHLAAVGKTSTLDWSEPTLMPWAYIVPPEDGIYDFSLLAEPPKGPGATAIGSLIATLPLGNRPEGFRGVRLHPGDLVVKL